MKYVLKIDFQDEKGFLIYKISDVIYKFGFNIETNHEWWIETQRDFFIDLL